MWQEILIAIGWVYLFWMISAVSILWWHKGFVDNCFGQLILNTGFWGIILLIDIGNIFWGS